MGKKQHSKYSLFETIAIFVKKNELIDSQKKIIVGFSGGPDSRLLLEWLLWYTKDPCRIIAAHLNHQWRSDADFEENSCYQTAKKLGVAFITKTISEYQDFISYNGSKEAFARIARRMFLEKIASEHNGIIALGHHQDDQIETFFIRLARGSTGTGLSGIKPKNGLYIRPLLEISKAQIYQELDKRQITYCLDSSNESTEYLRNNIRISLIPLLNKIDTRFKKNTIQTINHLQQAEEYLTAQTNKIIHEIGFTKNEFYVIQKDKFFILESYMQKRVLIKLLILTNNKLTIHNNLLNEIIRFLSNKSSNHKLSKQISIKQTKDFFWIESL